MIKVENISVNDKTPILTLQAKQDILLFLFLAGSFCVLEHVIGPSNVYSGFISIIGAFASVCLILIKRKQSIVSLGLQRPAKLKLLPAWIICIFIVATVLGGGSQVLAAQFIEQPIDLTKFEALHNNLPMLIFALVSIWVTAAFFEEVVFRGFLLSRLCCILGTAKSALFLAIVVHSLIFGLLHAYQGWLGIITTGTIALVFGTFFIVQQRNLWALIIVHGSIDTLGVLQFYLFGVPH